MGSCTWLQKETMHLEHPKKQTVKHDSFQKELHDWEECDSKAHSVLVRTITREVSLALHALTSAFEIMSKLEDKFAWDSVMEAFL